MKYIKYFRHWRSKKIIRAKDYGFKCFPIGGRGKLKTALVKVAVPKTS